MAQPLNSELADFARHAAGIRRYLKTPATVEGCIDRLRRDLDTGTSGFSTPSVAVSSPGRRAPTSASSGMPASSEATWRSSSATWESSRLLDRLYDAGVYVSIEEFRGARPIERPGLSLPVRASDFDNPLAASGWRVTTGASRSLGRQVLLNFDHLDRQLVVHRPVHLGKRHRRQTGGDVAALRRA